MGEGYLRRNPARAMERPTVVAMAPTELSERQRFVLKQLVEQHATRRFAAIFALGYWAGLRISEIATLRMNQCQVNQRAASITLVDAKGGKIRTLDLHNMARRALYDYLFPRTGSGECVRLHQSARGLIATTRLPRPSLRAWH